MRIPDLIRFLPALPVVALFAATAVSPGAAGKRAPGDSGGVGTHAEEYRDNTRGGPGTSASGTPVKPGAPSKPNNTTSTGRELTGPGAQPEEYGASGSKPVVTYDTVHNVRVQPDTTTATGRAWRDSVRGGTGPTKPGGTPPKPTVPKTPMQMPGSGGADPSVPGSGPAR